MQDQEMIDSEEVHLTGCGASWACDPRRRPHRYIVLFFICFLCFGSYFCYDNPAALQDIFINSLDMTKVEFMNLYAFYSWPNVVLSFVGGFLIDRVFGIPWGSIIFSIFVLIGQILFGIGAYFKNIPAMYFSRLLFGIGGESLAVAQNTYATEWFPSNELNLVFGLQLSMSRIGSTVNMVTMQPLNQAIGQHFNLHTNQQLGASLLIASVTCLFSTCCAVIMLFFTKRAKRILSTTKKSHSRHTHLTESDLTNHEQDQQHLLTEKTEDQSKKISFMDIIHFPGAIWLICVICVAYYVTVFPFVSLGLVFFQRKFGLSIQDAGVVNSIIYIISAVASPVFGAAIDFVGYNLYWLFTGISVTLGCHLCFAFTNGQIPPLVIMIIMGLSYSILASSLWPMVAYVLPLHQRGTAYGLIQSIQNLGLGLISIFAGYLVDTKGYLFLEVFFIFCLSIAITATFGLLIWDHHFGTGSLNESGVSRRRSGSVQIIDGDNDDDANNRNVNSKVLSVVLNNSFSELSMDNKNLEEIPHDPLLAPGKRKGAKKTRTVKDLFDDVGPEASFKDKRGRPWFKNPRAYVKQLLASKIQKDGVDKEPDSSSDEGSQLDVSETESSTSPSDDEEINVFEDIEDLQGADWYELTKDSIPATQTSHRLALLHFDWDNSKPETIYMVLESFLPARGHIEKVTIYPSEFGIKRMADEAIHGPLELRPTESDTESNERNNPTVENPTMSSIGDIDEKSGWRNASSKLRRRIREYQLARLKYFYAIIEFDSVETAEAIYTACDGLEYESSGSRLDLRFVDNDQQFEVPPEYAHLVSECREINKTKYAPVRFETSALHSTRIGITWDKTPADRTNWLRDQFRPDIDPKTTLTENRDELSKYLALSSSEASTLASSDPESEPPAPTVPRIRRHRPKKLPPAEIRLALLGLTSSTDKVGNGDLLNQDENDEEEEEEEEVLDLASHSPNDISDENEDYDLRPVERKKNSQTSQTSVSRRKVRRKVLPEARDSDEDVDDDDEEELGESNGPVEFNNENVDKPLQKNDKKRKKKLKQRTKILEKKRKVQARLERESKLWFGDNNNDNSDALCDIDDRFDDFLRNPAFEISQTHPDYKEAGDFLRYMKMRQSSKIV
ncbi:unnamed protein product [Schistosoma turkestanicum]|nr:unnamed protein product [Schistosoma turkestanicum]